MSVHTQNLLTLDDTHSAPRPNWDTERAALLADALHVGGQVRLEVRGESMLPALWPSDMVEIERCSSQDIQAGDILLAQRDGRLFLHRLIATSAVKGFELRGDSVPNNPDPWYKPDALLGRLVSHRDKPFVWGRIPALSRTVGLLFCHFALLRRLALKLYVNRKTKASELQGLEVSK